MPFKLASNQYGKSEVRLTKVTRQGAIHHLLEFSVNVTLSGDFSDSYIKGDNRKIIATDSIKNTVYVLAKENEFNSPEEFAILLASHFPKTYPQVLSAYVEVNQTHWTRIQVDRKPHDHAFECGGPDLSTASVVYAAGELIGVTGGIENLLILKTTQSAFKGFVTDKYRTLKDADDRIFATQLTAGWEFNLPAVNFADVRTRIHAAMLKVFSTQMSYAVQETMYQMGEAALAAVPEIKSIDLHMPNKHRIPVNLQPFNLENNNEIFVWTDEPFGDISCTVERD